MNHIYTKLFSHMLLAWVLWLTSSRNPIPHIMGIFPQALVCEQIADTMNYTASHPALLERAKAYPFSEDAITVTIRAQCLREGISPRQS